MYVFGRILRNIHSDIPVDLIPEVGAALRSVTVSRKMSVGKRQTNTDQVKVGGKYGSDEGIRDDMF